MLVTTSNSYHAQEVSFSSSENSKARFAQAFVEKKENENEKNVPKQAKVVQNDVFQKKAIEKLAEKISATQFYTKEASTAIAENLLAHRVELLA